MTASLIETLSATANHARYTGEQNGFYESYFIRANHPEKPLAFWIRYTIFAPRNNAAGAMGELWATWFDGATGRHVSVKDEFPLSECVFDNSPESFLEIATAQIKLGPVYTPRMTVMVLRHKGKEYALNTIGQSLKAKGKFDYFSWTFASEDRDVRIEGTIAAPKEGFVGLQYYNPPGGIKHCLNTKIASCRLSVLSKDTGTKETLTTGHRAAFEILTDDHHGHGVPIHA